MKRSPVDQSERLTWRYFLAMANQIAREGAGVLGFHLVERLHDLYETHHVAGIDRIARILESGLLGRGPVIENPRKRGKNLNACHDRISLTAALARAILV
jgi:nucleoside-diphosphate-sugar epimerase